MYNLDEDHAGQQYMRLQKILRPDNYRVYARMYDTINGDRSENIDLLGALIRKHRPQSKTVLELACGTGSVLQGLAGEYEIMGLDMSPAMLRVARKRLPNTPFVQANMVDFKLSTAFDVVYCFHNSMNHLVMFDEWSALFENVARHLKTGGLFIFDINSPERMETLVKNGRHIARHGDVFVATQITKTTKEPERYRWEVGIGKKRRFGPRIWHRTSLEVSAFPVERISRELEKNFQKAELFTLDHAHNAFDNNRSYSVWVKK